MNKISTVAALLFKISVVRYRVIILGMTRKLINCLFRHRLNKPALNSRQNSSFTTGFFSDFTYLIALLISPTQEYHGIQGKNR